MNLWCQLSSTDIYRCVREVTFSFNPKVGIIPQSLPIQEGNSFLETLGTLFPTDLTYRQVSYHRNVKSESVVHKWDKSWNVRLYSSDVNDAICLGLCDKKRQLHFEISPGRSKAIKTKIRVVAFINTLMIVPRC